MPLADSEGLGVADRAESRRAALRMRGDRNGVHGLLGQEPERGGTQRKNRDGLRGSLNIRVWGGGFSRTFAIPNICQQWISTSDKILWNLTV